MAITKKIIRKVWFDYMIKQYSKAYAKKYGEYNAKVHRIRDSGDIVLRSSTYANLVLEEVGMDYHTFRMKYNTMDNPVDNPGRKRPEITEV